MLSFIGGLMLLRSAARTLWRGGAPAAAIGQPPSSPRAAYRSALLVSATNPAALVSMVTLLAPSRRADLTPLAAGLVLAGVLVAGGGWGIGLRAAGSLLRARRHPAVLVMVSRVAGVLLSLYAALALARSVAWRGPPF